MPELAGLLPLALVMLVTGLAGGLIAGLLGVGGGIVVVPALELALAGIGVDPAVRMHVAVATSMATIIPTSISSARAHHARGAVDVPLVRRWSVPVLLGAFAGSLLAAHATSRILTALFGVVALAVAARMWLHVEGKHVVSEVPRTAWTFPIPLSIGVISAMMGIGGGTLSVPVMTLLNEPIHRAVGTASLFGLLISVPATLGFLLASHSPPPPPYSVGLVNLLGFALIAPATVLTAPLGAWLAHSLSQKALRAAFAFFLLVVAARMLYRTWIG